MLNLLRANWKRALTLMIWAVVGLNVVYFVQREMLSNSCSVDDIIKRQQAMQEDTASFVDGCTFARNDSRPTSISDLPETNWCMYDDEVDLRIVIMTFNRRDSLLRLLRQVTSPVAGLVILHCTVLIGQQGVTDRQTDGRLCHS